MLIRNGFKYMKNNGLHLLNGDQPINLRRKTNDMTTTANG